MICILWCLGCCGDRGLCCYDAMIGKKYLMRGHGWTANLLFGLEGAMLPKAWALNDG